MKDSTPPSAIRKNWDVYERAGTWLFSNDTGISSKTILAVILGFPCDWKSPPSDPADFGRCYRLLKKIPELRAELHQMRSEGDVWGALVDQWDELEMLYEEELPSGTAPKLYERMKQLGC